MLAVFAFLCKVEISHITTMATKRKKNQEPTQPFTTSKEQIISLNRSVMGIDPSLSSTGWCHLTGNHHNCGSITPAWKAVGPARLRDLFNKLDDILGEFLPSMVVLEGYSYGSSHHREALAEWGGLIRVLLFDRKIPTLIVAPTSLKKFVLSEASSEKDQMLLAVYKRWGVEFSNNDECDAYALSQLGRSRLELEMIAATSSSPSLFSGTQRMREAALIASPYIFPPVYSVAGPVRRRS